MPMCKAHELAKERDALRREVAQLQAGLERLQAQGELAHGQLRKRLIHLPHWFICTVLHDRQGLCC